MSNCDVAHACDLNTGSRDSSWETSLRDSYTMYQKTLHPGLLVQTYNPNYAGRSKVQGLPGKHRETLPQTNSKKVEDIIKWQTTCLA